MRKSIKLNRRLALVFPGFIEIRQMADRDEVLIIDYNGQSYIATFDRINESFSIMPGGQRTIIDDYYASKHFKIVNTPAGNLDNDMGVCFIPIDGQTGLLGFGAAHCDFAFFDEYDFCFVEMKLNAISLEERAVRKNRKKAIEQLANTIAVFDEKLSGNYEGLNLEAYVSTPETYPRNDTAWASMEVAFLEKHGIPLYEQSHKVCT